MNTIKFIYFDKKNTRKFTVNKVILCVTLRCSKLTIENLIFKKTLSNFNIEV